MGRWIPLWHDAPPSSPSATPDQALGGLEEQGRPEVFPALRPSSSSRHDPSDLPSGSSGGSGLPEQRVAPRRRGNAMLPSEAALGRRPDLPALLGRTRLLHLCPTPPREWSSADSSPATCALATRSPRSALRLAWREASVGSTIRSLARAVQQGRVLLLIGDARPRDDDPVVHFENVEKLRHTT